MFSRFLIPIVLSACALGISQNTCAQDAYRPGFIVTNDGDTVRGKLKFTKNRNNYRICHFRVNDQASTAYGPEDILRFGYDNDKVFTSEVLEDTFVEEIVSGEIGLYKTARGYVFKKDTVAILLSHHRQSSQVYSRYNKEDNSWRGLLAYHLDRIDDRSFIDSHLHLSEKHLTKLVVRHNENSAREYSHHKASKPSLQISYGPSLAMVRSTITSKDRTGLFPYATGTYRSIDPMAGLAFEISAPRTSEHLALLTALSFRRSSYNAITRDNEGDEHSHNFKFNALVLPLGLKWVLPRKPLSFFVSGGVQSKLNIGKDIEVFQINNPRATVLYSQYYKVVNFQLGSFMEVGISRAIKGFTAQISLRATRMSDLNRKRFGFDKVKGFTMAPNYFGVNVSLLKNSVWK